MSEELKPCPWCGCKEMVYYSSAFNERVFYCKDCFAQGPVGETEEEARELWNNRNLVVAKGEIDKLLEECQFGSTGVVTDMATGNEYPESLRR